MKEHKLEWTRPYSSLFEGPNVQPGVFIPRSNKKFKSTCWIRAMILVDASWLIVEGLSREELRSERIGNSTKIQIRPSKPDKNNPDSEYSISDISDLGIQFNLFSHLLPVGTYNLCTDIVPVGPVVDRNAIPTGIFHVFKQHMEVEGFCDFFVQQEIHFISSSSSSESLESIRPSSPDAIPASPSSSASRIHFTDEIPQTSQILVPPVFHPSIDFIGDIPHISMPTSVVLPTDFTVSFAQLRASVDKIQLEKVRTHDDVSDLKAALSSKITNFEVAFSNASTHQGRIFRNLIHDVQQKIKTQKDALPQDLNEFRKETQAGIDTLSAQLSEIIDYINRGRDDKKGEESSRGPPPDDRSIPGGGGSRPGEGGCRSEPPKRSGGSNRGSGSYISGRGSKSSGWSCWFG
ncbi:hypothetical protein F511_41248 [Dorcoceras hygrometricum]|uniref:Uncharacterized protein n=1 Tax=Dorcoceras hygrometricum TaxID=472368 RepID=A0A2Z7A734_9LAMI|nr:hypothetical protein F511_41248 [Dorcoceras hygrometricum]